MEWKKMMKVFGAAVLVTAACAGLAGCGGAKADGGAGSAKTVKLGFLNGVSGGVAAYGLAEKEGFDLAVEEINAKGELHLETEMVDTKGVVQQAVAAAQKMISGKKLAVVGPLISGEYKAVGPLFEQAKIPLVGVHRGRSYRQQQVPLPQLCTGISEHPADRSKDSQASGLQDGRGPLLSQQ